MAMTNGQGEDADVDRFLAEAGISVDDSGARIVLRFSNEDGTPLKPKPVDPILIEAEITKVLADISEAIHKKIHDGCLTIREIASRGSSNWHYLLTQELYERPHHVADVTTNDFKGNMSQFIKEATFVRLEKGNDN